MSRDKRTQVVGCNASEESGRRQSEKTVGKEESVVTCNDFPVCLQKLHLEHYDKGSRI